MDVLIELIFFRHLKPDEIELSCHAERSEASVSSLYEQIPHMRSEWAVLIFFLFTNLYIKDAIHRQE